MSPALSSPFASRRPPTTGLAYELRPDGQTTAAALVDVISIGHEPFRSRHFAPPAASISMVVPCPPQPYLGVPSGRYTARA